MTEAQPKAEFLEQLNEQQLAAVTAHGSALVISGAGTGKTRVITARIAHLISRGVSPERIMAVTFTNKAANEIKERIAMSVSLHGLVMGTFHSLCGKILRKHPQESGLPANFAIMDSADQLSFVRRILREQLGLPPQSEGGPNPRDVRNAIMRLKERGQRSADVGIHDAEKLVRDVYAIYEPILREEGKADFVELILRCNEVLREFAEVRNLWAARYDHVLIDELQDISRMQMDWIELIRGRNTCYFGVGDDDQSIYAFRGADPQLMQQFMHRFDVGNVMRLESNYRSTDRILDLANAIISGNANRLGKTLRGTTGVGELPLLENYATDEEEARGVVRAISNMSDSGVSLNSVAVLYRNHVLAQLIEQQMRSADLNYRVRGAQRFFDRNEVKNAIAYLQIAANSDDNEAFARTVNMPPRKFGHKAMATLANAAEGGSLWSAADQFCHAGLAKYVDVVKRIRAMAGQGDLAKAAKEAVVGSGLVDYYVSRKEQERADHLAEVVSAAARFAEHDSGSLEEFLASVVLDSDPEHVGSQHSCVSLMTIHAAKGLEFDHVFLVGIENGILPAHSAFSDTSQLAEERRLLYVATTRARKTLNLSWVNMRRQLGQYKGMTKTILLRNVNAKFLRCAAPADEKEKCHEMPFVFEKPQLAPPSDYARDTVGGYRIDQKVAHKRFGRGVILSFQGSGEQVKVNVFFHKDHKRKWLVLRLANLKPFRDTD